MKMDRRKFLEATTLTPAAVSLLQLTCSDDKKHPGNSGHAEDGTSPFEWAKKHTLHFNGPAVNFFQGALLGNGGMGVVVNTRPDGVVLRFGHNNVWDIRIAENHRREIGTFKEVLERIEKIPADAKESGRKKGS